MIAAWFVAVASAVEIPEDAALVEFSVGDEGATMGTVRLPGGSDLPILHPNTPLYVCVTAPNDLEYRVGVGGTRGLYRPPIAELGEPGPGVAPSTEEVHREKSCFGPFAPRLPGPADVWIQLDPRGPQETVAELEVAKSYSGAVRIGVAVGTVVDQGFDAGLAPDGGTRIARTADGAAQGEFVLGASYFFQRGGRIYEAPSRRFVDHLGLYGAIGLVDAGPTGALEVSALQSVYLGLEYEIAPSASVGVAAVGRRVDVLAPGFKVGDAFSGARVPTVSELQGGVAFVFNLTPEFMRIARPGSGRK